MTPATLTVTNLSPQRFLLPNFGVLEVDAKNIEVPPSDDLLELIEVGAVHEGHIDSAYDSQNVPQLEALAAERGLQVEGTRENGRVLKADLITALEAADTTTPLSQED